MREKKTKALEEIEVIDERPTYSFRDVLELKECDNFEEANKYLGDAYLNKRDRKERWILLKVYMNTVQHYATTPDGVKTFQKFIKVYLLGRVEG